MKLRRFRFGEIIQVYDQMGRQLYVYRGRLSMELAKVNNRLEKLQEYMDLYKERGDLEMAAIYAREYKALYVVREILWHMILRLDGVMARIDTVKKLASGFDGMGDTLKAVSDVIKVAGPAVSGFEELARNLYTGYTELVVDASVPVTNMYVAPVEDAKEILRNIEKDVVKELAKKFPKIPRDIEVSPEAIPKLVNRLYEAIATDGGVAEVMVKPRDEEVVGIVRVSLNREELYRVSMHRLERLERAVLNYLLKNYRGGEVSLNLFRFARAYRTTPMKVLDALYSLSEIGLIRFG